MKIDIENVVLSSGAHNEDSGEHCLLEVVSLFAGAAAGAAAKQKLEPTVIELQASAHDLFSRMIDAE